MAETTKKRSRKSKLEIRQFTDVDDIKETRNVIQVPTTSENALKLLPKLHKALNESTTDQNHDNTHKVEFSVQIEIESCDDSQDFEIHELDADTSKPGIISKDTVPTTQELVIFNDEVFEEIHKLYNSTNYAERMLAISARNSWGRYPRSKHVPDQYDAMVQRVLGAWRSWNAQSTARKNTMFLYKCVICSLGWWHLGPFREHIRIHKNVMLKLQSLNHECYMICSKGEWYENMCLCKVEGHCSSCALTYEEHDDRRKGTVVYHCEGCNDRFSTCSQLFKHEGSCVRFEKMIYRNSQMMDENMWRCGICHIPCLTKERYDRHLVYTHVVRSDMPAKFTIMKTCSYCRNEYHLYHAHECPNRNDNSQCKYCLRNFQNRFLLKIHDENTKENYSCRICKSQFKKQCREWLHYMTHTKRFVQVYKCTECHDNVLLWSKERLNSHRNKRHQREHTNRCKYTMVLVPKSCFYRVRTDGVTVEDMVIETNSLKDRSATVVNPESSEEFLEFIEKRKHNKEEIDKIHKNLKEKMLQRAQSKTAGSTDDKAKPTCEIVEIDDKDDDDDDIVEISDLQNSVDTLLKRGDVIDGDNVKETDSVDEFSLQTDADDFDDDDIMKMEQSVNELLQKSDKKRDGDDDTDIKQLKDPIEKLKQSDSVDDDSDIEAMQASVDMLLKKNDDVVVIDDDDDDIKEMQDSVNELLNSVGKDEDIEIEEPIYEQIVIDDDDDDGLEAEHVITKTNDIKEEEKVTKQEKEETLPYIKEEIINEEYADDVHDSANSEPEREEMEDTFDIKQEIDEFEEDIDERIRNEQEACLEELCKVFQAPHDAQTVELTGISCIKDEPLDEELNNEDDITNLQQSANYDVSVNVKSEDCSKEFSLEDMSALEPDVNMEVDDDDNHDDSDDNSISRRSERLKVGKQYRCLPCKFVGNHKEYAKHKTSTCVIVATTYARLSGFRSPWQNVKCTKCNTVFTTLKRYYMHFTKHNLKYGTCPRCFKEFPTFGRVRAEGGTKHLTWHIRNSFLKVQLLNESSYESTKDSGLYQCKDCSEKVGFDDFFKHWEKHLDLEAKNEEKTLNLNENNIAEPRKAGKTSLRHDQVKLLLNQLIMPVDKPLGKERAFMKRCDLCARHFVRKNDTKRHVIEHLLWDSYSRQPAMVCQLCDEQFRRPDAYRTHMRNHAGLPVFRCEMCDKCFSDSSNFAKHKKVHNVNVLSTCEICNKKFNSKVGLEKHMEMHRTTKPVNCEKCARVFYTPASYRRHYRAVHDKSQPVRNCRICRDKFYTIKDMWNHMWLAHQERRQKADCPLCDMSFRKYQDVRTHLSTAHRSTHEGEAASRRTAHGSEAASRRTAPGGEAASRRTAHGGEAASRRTVHGGVAASRRTVRPTR